jgi:hypothetical protein
MALNFCLKLDALGAVIMIAMPNRLIRVLIVGAAFLLIFKFVFPHISYTPGADTTDYSLYLLILLGVGAIFLKVARLNQR